MRAWLVFRLFVYRGASGGVIRVMCHYTHARVQDLEQCPNVQVGLMMGVTPSDGKGDVIVGFGIEYQYTNTVFALGEY